MNKLQTKVVDSGIEFAKPHFFEKITKTMTTSSKSDAQNAPKVAKQDQQTPKVTSKSNRQQQI